MSQTSAMAMRGQLTACVRAPERLNFLTARWSAGPGPHPGQAQAWILDGGGMIKRALEALLVAGDWFSGGYIFAWWTPYALQAGWLGGLSGMVLRLRVFAVEDKGDQVSLWRLNRR